MPRPQADDARNRETPPADPQRSEIVSTVEPRRRGNPARLPALPSQFSGQPIQFHPVTTLPSPTRPLLNTPIPTGEFSTGLGQDSASRSRRATLVHLKPSASSGSVRSANWDTLRRVLDLLAKAGFQVSQLAVNNPDGHESCFRDWTWPSGAPIACLIAQLERQGAYAYLLEKERTGSEYGPLLIAWHTDHREASESALDALLSLRANGRTWPKSHADWVLFHLPHRFSSDATYAAGIQGRLQLPEPPLS